VSDIPLCQNFIKKRGCTDSRMRLIESNEHGWSFFCDGCKSVQVVSSDGVRDRSKFLLAEQRRKEQEELDRRWSKRRKIFA